MTAVFTILVSLIVITPVLTVVDSTFVCGLILANAATATALIALSFHAGEFRRLTQLVEPVAPLLLIPCIWMFVQIVPIPGPWLTHPAWASASTALGKPLIGAISLDIGATLLSLAQYSLIVSVAIISTAVSLDRQRAEIILLLLTASAVTIAAGLVAIDLGYFRVASLDIFSLRSQAINIAVIGAVLSGTSIIHSYENAQIRHPSSEKKRFSPNYPAAISILAFAVCVLAITIAADEVMLFATACGTAALISVVAIRKLRLGSWGQCGISAAAVIALVGFFAANPPNRDVDLTLWFSNQPTTVIATADRILSDASLAGTGAGSFEAVLPIYRDADLMQSITAPTTAALTAVEMGRPFFWGLVILAIAGACVLFRRALLRGRDYYYAACGAGCIIAVLIASFASAGISNLAASILASAVLGMAFAQSKRSGNSDEIEIPVSSGTRSIEQAGYGRSAPAQMRFRAGLLIFSAVLASLSVWVIAAEYYRPRRIYLPVDQQAGLLRADRDDRQNAKRAASLGLVRGDLWAESAFTYSDLLWNEPTTAQDPNGSNEARLNLENAVRYSPHRGDVWLMLAALADRYNWQGYQPNALLKMSYYTAPNEFSLFPLRFQVSLRPNNLQDLEIQDLIRRDIRVVVTKAPLLKPALIAAYKAAPSASKAMVERLISEIDPTYLAAMRAGLQ